jgi:hypothetical protein
MEIGLAGCRSSFRAMPFAEGLSKETHIAFLTLKGPHENNSKEDGFTQSPSPRPVKLLTMAVRELDAHFACLFAVV